LGVDERLGERVLRQPPGHAQPAEVDLDGHAGGSGLVDELLSDCVSVVLYLHNKCSLRCAYHCVNAFVFDTCHSEYGTTITYSEERRPPKERRLPLASQVFND